LNIVSITLGERDNYYGLADIVIDCKHHDSKRYFVSPEHSICNNPDFPFPEIAQLIKKLDWDSDFFGFNVAFLSCKHLTDNIYARIERFLRAENIRLVEYLCNCHDARSVRVAEDKGFRFTDIRLQFSRSLEQVPAVEIPGHLVFGMADEGHIPRLREIAHGIYLDSRYHFDSNFDQERVVEFYKNWVEKAVWGQFDHECWCLFHDGAPEAFCTVRYGSGKRSTIGLVGTSREQQNQGLGKLLLFKVLSHLGGKGYQEVVVVTQGRNYAAQNLYQGAGFHTKVTQLWYHKWI
jgi:ribosomal protein S18 acetylase RimI-like enzyme